ncbi:glycosyl transferase family, a/b domain-containing protein [Suillus spraguei]|nr:glycosyl transferase family, a/b domain-containing protein [Suillus spraguei]
MNKGTFAEYHRLQAEMRADEHYGGSSEGSHRCTRPSNEEIVPGASHNGDVIHTDFLKRSVLDFEVALVGVINEYWRLSKTPGHFTPEDLELALYHIFTLDATLPAQIGAFLAAAADVLRAQALQAAIEDGDIDFVVDIVGTGGDGHNTFNVSTTAAVAAAGARVIKHGSRASTSSSESADLLQSLDCSLTAPSSGTAFPISKIPFTFILAPHYHPPLVVALFLARL